MFERACGSDALKHPYSFASNRMGNGTSIKRVAGFLASYQAEVKVERGSSRSADPCCQDWIKIAGVMSGLTC